MVGVKPSGLLRGSKAQHDSQKLSKEKILKKAKYTLVNKKTSSVTKKVIASAHSGKTSQVSKKRTLKSPASSSSSSSPGKKTKSPATKKKSTPTPSKKSPAKSLTGKPKTEKKETPSKKRSKISLPVKKGKASLSNKKAPTPLPAKKSKVSLPSRKNNTPLSKTVLNSRKTTAPRKSKTSLSLKKVNNSSPKKSKASSTPKKTKSPSTSNKVAKPPSSSKNTAKTIKATLPAKKGKTTLLVKKTKKPVTKVKVKKTVENKSKVLEKKSKGLEKKGKGLSAGVKETPLSSETTRAVLLSKKNKAALLFKKAKTTLLNKKVKTSKVSAQDISSISASTGKEPKSRASGLKRLNHNSKSVVKRSPKKQSEHLDLTLQVIENTESSVEHSFAQEPFATCKVIVADCDTLENLVEETPATTVNTPSSPEPVTTNSDVLEPLKEVEDISVLKVEELKPVALSSQDPIVDLATDVHSSDIVESVSEENQQINTGQQESLLPEPGETSKPDNALEESPAKVGAAVKRSEFSFGRTNQTEVLKYNRPRFSTKSTASGKKHLKALCSDDIQKLISSKSPSKSSHVLSPLKDNPKPVAAVKSPAEFGLVSRKSSPQKLSAQRKKVIPIIRLEKLPIVSQKSRIKLSGSVEEDLKLFISETKSAPKSKPVKPGSNLKGLSQKGSNSLAKKLVTSVSKHLGSKPGKSDLVLKRKSDTLHQSSPSKKFAQERAITKHRPETNLKKSLLKKSKSEKQSAKGKSEKLEVDTSSDQSDMDFLQCGRCSSTFTSLKLFVSHKKNGCKVPTIPAPSRPVKKTSTPKFATHKELVSEALRKNAQKTKSANEVRRKCGECPGCVRRDDCAECQNCLDNGLTCDAKLKKQCLLRQCDALFENQVYQVERLVGKRLHKSRTEYLVKWKGYPDSENTWEPESNVISKALIDEFLKRQKEAREKSEQQSLDRATTPQLLGKRDARPPSPSSPASIDSSTAKRAKPDEETFAVPATDPAPDQAQVVEQEVETPSEAVASSAESEIQPEVFPAEPVSAPAPDDEEEENPNLTEIKLFLASEFGDTITPAESEVSATAAADQPLTKDSDSGVNSLTSQSDGPTSLADKAAPTTSAPVEGLESTSEETAVLTYTTLDGEISKTVPASTILKPEAVPNVIQRNARKSMKSSSNRFSTKEVADILEELRNEVASGKERKEKVAEEEEDSLGEIDEEEIAAIEDMEEVGYFDEEDEDAPRRGRTTKQAALDFIRTVCHKIKQRQKTEAELEAERSRRRRKKMSLMGSDGHATDSYEKNLDLSKATSAIYIQNPDEPSSYILVKGDQEQISFLEGANLSPQVIVNAKEPLRQATPWVELPSTEPTWATEEVAVPEVFDQEVEDLPSTSAGMMEDSFEELFGMDDNSWGVDPSLSDTSSIMGGDMSGAEGPPPAPMPRKRTGRPALPPIERKVLTPFGGAKRKPGRPPKSESLARLAMLRELQGDSANSEDTMESTPGRQDETVPTELLGMYERRRQKPRQFDEYIDPDTLLKDEPENVVVPGRRSLKHQDEDFEPPTLPKPPTGRPRGRPPKHYNINDITDEMDFRRKFIKTMPQKTEGGRGRGKKNRVFVVMPDGTMVEVSGNDREKAIARATAKMEVLRKNVVGRGRGVSASEDHGGNLIGGMRRRTDLRPSIEECTTDTVDDPSMLKLPSTVQLVESELPLTEAENGDKLVGMFLFRQIYSPNDPNLFCLMCRNKYPLTYPVDLEKHYHVIHELGVQIFKAEFSEDIVFVCVPSDVSEDTMLNSGCRFCDETLKTLSEVRSHYPEVHGKNVRLVPENSVMELGENFYCSICSHDSKDFNDHHKHMKEQHRMQTYACRFCNFCTPKPNRLRTHVKQRHLQEQPGPHLQCSVCSVYVHGKERLNKHILLSHAVQTGPRTWSCAKCLQPCGDARELMAHIHKCPFLRGQNQVAALESAATATPAEVTEEENSGGKSTLFYKCTLCSLTFSSEDDIKRHMTLGIHPTVGEELDGQGELKTSDLSDPAVVALGGSEVATSEGSAEDATCFLCHLRFPSKDLCLLHQHHIHMRWVAKGVVDYSPEELQDLPPEIIVAETLELSQLMKKNMRGSSIPIPAEPLPETEPLTAEEEEARALERALMEGLDEPMQEDNQKETTTTVAPVAPSISASTNSPSKDLNLCMADIPSDQRLAELGFPTKVGHFCHLCDAVIKSYALYYLHMHNLHGLERRFQCIVSACSRTYHSPLAFQRHAQTHNQKSEDLCSMCDHVFNNDDELQEHLVSPEHATKYMRVQEKYNRSEPRNYRCKVCHSWFGLFATFVKHMETESHQYQCQHCGLLFVQPGPRRNHIQSIHPELANICEICGVQMPNSQALWSHLSLHSIVHECQKCHRRFLQKEQLTAHMEIHAPPTPCPWEGCNRKLSTKVGLYNHLRMHRGDADYKCSVCNKGFFKKKTLEAHMRVHEENSNGIPASTAPVGRGRGRQSKQQQLELNPSLVFQHQGEDLELTDAEQVLAEQQMAEALQIDLQEAGENAATENMTSVELVQLICAGCLNGFDSEEQFTQHACVGHATPEQAEAAVALLSGQDQQIILQTDNSEDLGSQLVGQHAGLQSLSANDEDLAAQLAKAVAEATGPGGGRVTVSFAGGQPVAMVNGQMVTMATIGEDGQPIEATLESLIESGAVTAGEEGLHIEDTALMHQVEQPMEEEETAIMVPAPMDEDGGQAQQETMEVLVQDGTQIIDQNLVEQTEVEGETVTEEDTELVEEDFAVTKEEGTEFIVATDRETELPVTESADHELPVAVVEGVFVEEGNMTEEAVEPEVGAEVKEEDDEQEEEEEAVVEGEITEDAPRTVMITEEEAYLLAGVQGDAEDAKETVIQEGVDVEQSMATETVMITEEEAYLLAGAQGESLEHEQQHEQEAVKEDQEQEHEQEQEGLAITMEDGQEGMNIVMMVGDENGELDGNQPYSVVKVPTADGGEQVLLIPLTTTEGGDTVLALPDNLTLADQEGSQMAVTFAQQDQDQEMEQEQDQDQEGQQVYMTLPVMPEDEASVVPGEEEIESVDVPQQETHDISDTL